MELILRAGCWKIFVPSWQKLHAPIINTICSIALLIDKYNDRLLPLLRQFFLIPNRNNKFMVFIANFSTPLPEKILLGLDQYLVIWDFLAFQ